MASWYMNPKMIWFQIGLMPTNISFWCFGLTSLRGPHTNPITFRSWWKSKLRVKFIHMRIRCMTRETETIYSQHLERYQSSQLQHRRAFNDARGLAWEWIKSWLVSLSRWVHIPSIDRSLSISGSKDKRIWSLKFVHLAQVLISTYLIIIHIELIGSSSWILWWPQPRWIQSNLCSLF